MKSWHYNEYTDSSAIQEVFNVLNKDNFIYIFTEDNDFMVTYEDNVTIGIGALMIVSRHADGRWVQLINTDKITHIELRPVKKDDD